MASQLIPINQLKELNSVAQQPMRYTTYFAPLSRSDLSAEVLEIFHSGGQSDVNPPVFSPLPSLGLAYRPTEGMKG
ncbi:hypothetical protein TNCV_4535831 [Trichonephila clavipes]|nr:hypothetical protein TNCV_4535831 [Trichonephila clavipes]